MGFISNVTADSNPEVSSNSLYYLCGRGEDTLRGKLQEDIGGIVVKVRKAGSDVVEKVAETIADAYEKNGGTTSNVAEKVPENIADIFDETASKVAQKLPENIVDIIGKIT